MTGYLIEQRQNSFAIWSSAFTFFHSTQKTPVTLSLNLKCRNMPQVMRLHVNVRKVWSIEELIFQYEFWRPSPRCSERLTFDLCTENESSGLGHAVRVAVLIQNSALEPQATLTRTLWQNQSFKDVYVLSSIINIPFFAFLKAFASPTERGKTDWAGPFTFKGQGIETLYQLKSRVHAGTLGKAVKRRNPKLFWCTSVNSQCQKQRVRKVTVTHVSSVGESHF